VQIAPLHYPHLSQTEIFNSVEEFYRRFYFRSGKIASIVGEMVRDRQMMIRGCVKGSSSFTSCESGEEWHTEGVDRNGRRLGLAPKSNEAVETAHRNGILTSASLMVGLPPPPTPSIGRGGCLR